MFAKSNNSLAPSGVGAPAPPSGESWIHHCNCDLCRFKAMSYRVRFPSRDVNTPLQLDLLHFGLAFARCEHTFIVGSLTVCFGCRSVWTHLYNWIPYSLFWLSISVNTPLQLDLLQFVLAFIQCEHTFTVGSLTLCFGFHPVWTHLYSWISYTLFWLSISVNTPLQLDLLHFVLAFVQCEHTFTVGSLTLCFGFHPVWTHLYSWISYTLFWLSISVNTPLQLDLLHFVLAFIQCEHTFTVGSLTVCFGFHSVWTHLYSWISHSLFWLSLDVNTPLQLDFLVCFGSFHASVASSSSRIENTVY